VSLSLQSLRITPRSSWDTFWRWWRDGLLAWLPFRLRRWLAGSSRRLAVNIEDNHLVLLREDSHQNQELARFDRLAPDWKAVTEWFKTEKPHQLVLRFPADQGLKKILSLPLAAEKNPRQVAGFDMDRLTPFSAAQVYYDVSVLERQLEQRRLRVELFTLPRTGVDPVLTDMQQWGLRPDVLNIVGGNPLYNLLPPEQRPARRGLSEQRLLTALILGALALVAVAAILPIWQQRQMLVGAIKKNEQLRQAADQALALRDQLDRTLEASQVLPEKKRGFPPSINVLRELTAILPEDTWLERLQVKGDTLQIIGQSAKASALISIIEASRLFNSAGFMSPVTTDPRTNKERFVLGARIRREP